MLGDHDLTNPHDVEILRRSVAMLSSRVEVFKREEALRLLEALAVVLEDRSESVPADTYERIADLAPGEWALNREQALKLMNQLHEATNRLVDSETKVKRAKRRLNQAGLTNDQTENSWPASDRS